MSKLAPGTPCWVDLGTPDLEDAKRFYTGLFGWTAHVSPEPDAGGYTLFRKGEHTVAGAGPLFNEAQPPAWSTYVCTDDADATAQQAEAAGGRVLVAPFDVMDQGRMAVLLDQSGAPFSIWQPMAMPGADLFNEPGSLSWNELTTRDPDGSKVFYNQVFGWESDDQDMGPITYTTFRLGDRQVAGMMPMVGDEWPADLPPHWMVYFAVDDTDEAATTAAKLGGAVSVPPNDIPQGRFAVLNDKQGAVFTVMALNRG
jgi:uncharacterized protein